MTEAEKKRRELVGFLLQAELARDDLAARLEDARQRRARDLRMRAALDGHIERTRRELQQLETGVGA